MKRERFIVMIMFLPNLCENWLPDGQSTLFLSFVVNNSTDYRVFFFFILISVFLPFLFQLIMSTGSGPRYKDQTENNQVNGLHRDLIQASPKYGKRARIHKRGLLEHYIPLESGT